MPDYDYTLYAMIATCGYGRSASRVASNEASWGSRAARSNHPYLHAPYASDASDVSDGTWAVYASWASSEVLASGASGASDFSDACEASWQHA